MLVTSLRPVSQEVCSLETDRIGTTGLDERDPLAKFAAELRALHQAAGNPPLPKLVHQARKQRPPVILTPSSLSAWLNGKNPPKASPGMKFLLEFLHDQAKSRGIRTLAVLDYEGLRRAAWAHTHTNRGGRPAARPLPVTPAAHVAASLPTHDPLIVVGRIPREPPAFVHRTAIATLAAAAESGRAAVTCAVTGLRGVGKTQVAAAYARSRIAVGHGLVGWVNAESSDVLLTGLARVAEYLGVADPEGDSLESANRLREHLESRNGTGLIVFNNASDPDTLLPYLPAAGKTQLVVTSTDRAFSDWGTPIDVAEFDRAQSVSYLTGRTGLEGGFDADAVAEKLGDLPLALSQAATTISRRHWTFKRYLTELIQIPVDKLLGPVRGDEYSHSVAAAMLLSVQSAEDADQTGVTGLLLRVLAALSPDGVPLSLLKRLAHAQAVDLDAILELCVTTSLLTWAGTGDAVIMHRLLGRVLRERDQEAGRWLETVRAALDSIEPGLFEGEHTIPQHTQETGLAVQIEVLWDAYTHSGVPDLLLAERLLRARSRAVQLLTTAADASRAAAIGTSVLADAVRILGDDHPDTLASRSDLAYAFLSTWRMQEAIPLYEQAIADSIRVLGRDQPATLASQSNLAQAYRYAGRLAEAIELLEQVLADRIRVLGEEHPDALNSRNSLANAYLYAGRLDEAISFYEETLTGRERILGKDDRDTATSRDNLVAAYEAERLSQAIPLYEQSLADCIRSLGHDHPDTRAARDNLADIYRRAERPGMAIQLYDQNLTDCIRALGHDHPDTRAARDNLASTYRFAGRLSEAIVLYEESLSRCTRVLGMDNPETLTAQGNLAYVYRLAGRIEEAITLYEESFSGRVRVLGEYHPDTITLQNALAVAYELAGRADEAI
jgi:tetratricopeptide (TPR) repeat protein